MTRSDAAAVVLALAAAACDASGGSPPRPAAIRPAVGFGAGGEVEIVGEGFEVLPVQEVNGGRSEVDAGYRAWLGPVELTDVAWVDARTLRATVPAGLVPGRYDLAVEGPLGRGVLSNAWEVIAGAPASLAASMALPATIGVGEDLYVAVTVSNGGEALVEGVRVEVSATGTGPVTCLATPGTQEIAAGEARAFVSRCRASAAGEVVVAAVARGTDPRTGSAVSASASGNVVAEVRAGVALTVFVPPGPLPLGTFPVAVTLANLGTAAATSLAVSAPAVTDASTAAAVLVSAPSVEATLEPGVARTFTWTYRAIASGSLQLEATATWTDDSGTSRSAAATSGFARVEERTQLLAVNPLGDGAPFAFIAPYRGDLWVGPSRQGTMLARVSLDPAPASTVALSFFRDGANDSTSSNSQPPYRSIGFYGCTSDATCGPDDEDGRGLLTSVTFAGQEWLVLGGARSGGELDYVYLSAATGSPLAFSYVDIGGLLGSSTKGFTAAQVAGGRLYLGFADSGGSRPYGVSLLAAPPTGGGGLDVVEGIHAYELGLHEAYVSAYNAFTTISMVDAIAELNGRVYLFNNSGCIGSTTPTPRWSGDFFACSPVEGLDYVRSGSVVPPRQHDLEPRDRAWPQVAAWNGRLFAARNTTSGPQLWSCDPAHRGDALVCDSGDWHLVAADASYRTRLGSASASAVTLVVGTPTHLFVGFDDPGGLQVFRTRAADPLDASDFTGAGGCDASSAACDGLGGAGLGAALTRIFDAKAVATPDARTDLFLTAGNGTGPVHVVRMAP